MSDQNKRATDKISVRMSVIVGLLTVGGVIYKFGDWILIAMMSSTFETQKAHAEDMQRHEEQEAIQRDLLAEKIVNKIEAIYRHHDR